MNTVWVIVSVIIVLLIAEAVSLRRKDDAWWTITFIMRKLPKWVVFLFGFTVGLLVGHFYWQ